LPTGSSLDGVQVTISGVPPGAAREVLLVVGEDGVRFAVDGDLHLARRPRHLDLEAVRLHVDLCLVDLDLQRRRGRRAGFRRLPPIAPRSSRPRAPESRLHSSRLQARRNPTPDPAVAVVTRPGTGLVLTWTR
jgi:hypothetical protein